jgi:hypothetical protein
MFFNKNVNRSTVDNDHASFIGLLSVKDGDFLIRFVNDTDEFECNLILEINTEMSQEENGLFDDSHVSF